MTLICDGGERYAGTYGSDTWLRTQGLDIARYLVALERFLETGDLPDVGPDAPGGGVT